MKKFYTILILITSTYTINLTNNVNGVESNANNNVIIHNKNLIQENYNSTLDNRNNQLIVFKYKPETISVINKQYKMFYAQYKYYTNLFNFLINDISWSISNINNNITILSNTTDDTFNGLFKYLNISDDNTKNSIKQIIFTKKSYDFYYYWLKQLYNNTDKLYGNLKSFKENYYKILGNSDLNKIDSLLYNLPSLATSIKSSKNKMKENKSKLNNKFNSNEYYDLVSKIVQYKTNIKTILSKSNEKEISIDMQNKTYTINQLTLVKQLKYIINIYELWEKINK